MCVDCARAWLTRADEKRSDTAREKGNGAKTEHVEDAKNEKTTSQA